MKASTAVELIKRPQAWYVEQILISAQKRARRGCQSFCWRIPFVLQGSGAWWGIATLLEEEGYKIKPYHRSWFHNHVSHIEIFWGTPRQCSTNS